MSEKTEAVITNDTGEKIAKALERIATAREQLVNSNAIAKLSIGSVTSGFEAFAAINNGRLDFVLPRGEKGEKGDTGAAGPKGEPGATGSTGPRVQKALPEMPVRRGRKAKKVTPAKKAKREKKVKKVTLAHRELKVIHRHLKLEPSLPGARPRRPLRMEN